MIDKTKLREGCEQRVNHYRIATLLQLQFYNVFTLRYFHDVAPL